MDAVLRTEGRKATERRAPRSAFLGQVRTDHTALEHRLPPRRECVEPADVAAHSSDLFRERTSVSLGPGLRVDIKACLSEAAHASVIPTHL